MKHLPSVLLAAVAFGLHQDTWYWRSSAPLLVGVLPPGLWYHALYAIACSALMWHLTRAIWPAHLDGG